MATSSTTLVTASIVLILAIFASSIMGSYTQQKAHFKRRVGSKRR